MSLEDHWRASRSIFLSFMTLSHMILIHTKDWGVNVTVHWWLLQFDVIYLADADSIFSSFFLVSQRARLALQLLHMSLPLNFRKCQHLPTTSPFKLFTILQVVYKDLLTCCKYYATATIDKQRKLMSTCVQTWHDMYVYICVFVWQC